MDYRLVTRDAPGDDKRRSLGTYFFIPPLRKN